MFRNITGFLMLSKHILTRTVLCDSLVVKPEFDQARLSIKITERRDKEQQIKRTATIWKFMRVAYEYRMVGLEKLTHGLMSFIYVVRLLSYNEIW